MQGTTRYTVKHMYRYTKWGYNKPIKSVVFPSIMEKEARPFRLRATEESRCQVTHCGMRRGSHDHKFNGP